MRTILALATLLSFLVACASALPSKPPIVRTSAAHDIKLTYWNGDTLTDPGGLDEPCDRGCLAQAEDHLRSLGDAGTAHAVWEAQAGVSACLATKCGRH